MKKINFIATALFTTTLFVVSCNNQTEENTPESTPEVVETPVNYLEIGQEMAAQTKSSLGKNLVLAITEKGAAGAVDFCNIQAIPITDSMSVALGAKIKRVSDKPRNPENQANESELEYIQAWKNAKANHTSHPGKITEINGKMVGYYPILTNSMCLQCHGQPKTEINTATQNELNKKYPKDLAVGYAENEIRGIFVVEMDKQEQNK